MNNLTLKKVLKNKNSTVIMFRVFQFCSFVCRCFMFSSSLKKSKSLDKSLDVYIGQRIKFRRSALGISQSDLGKSIDMTFQQIQKYEKGVNRVSASTLYGIAKVLKTNVSYFVDDYHSSTLNDDSVVSYMVNTSANRETTSLLRAFNKIPNESTRKKCIELVKMFVSSSAEMEKV
jgi:transcriptional regulator with XRE-family HTH domain